MVQKDYKRVTEKTVFENLAEGKYSFVFESKKDKYKAITSILKGKYTKMKMVYGSTIISFEMKQLLFKIKMRIVYDILLNRNPRIELEGDKNEK